jgi:hypothetical protein
MRGILLKAFKSIVLGGVATFMLATPASAQILARPGGSPASAASSLTSGSGSALTGRPTAETIRVASDCGFAFVGTIACGYTGNLAVCQSSQTKLVACVSGGATLAGLAPSKGAVACMTQSHRVMAGAIATHGYAGACLVDPSRLSCIPAAISFGMTMNAIAGLPDACSSPSAERPSGHGGARSGGAATSGTSGISRPSSGAGYHRAGYMK